MDRIQSAEKEVNEEREKIRSLMNEKTNLENRVKVLTEDIHLLRGDIENIEEERQLLFYEKGKEGKYKNVDLTNLVIRGKAFVTIKCGNIFEFTVSNLTKRESAEIDEGVSDLKDRNNVSVSTELRIRIMAYALQSYGEIGNAINLPDSKENRIEAIRDINEDVFNTIYNEYLDLCSWIKAAIRFELKNS